jgi:N-acetylglucosamine-6-phosphate deacetylase
MSCPHQHAVAADSIFDGSAVHRHAVVLIEGERIASIGPRRALPEHVTVHELPHGCWLAPGFIDVQVNGGGDLLFNDAPNSAAINRIIAAHRRYGTTGLLPTLISDTPQKMRVALDAVQSLLQNSGVLGIHFEGPFLSPAKPGIHDPSKLRLPTAADLALLSSSATVKLVTLAPEEVPNGFIAELVKSGVRVALGHSMATYAQTKAALAEGLTGFTHLFNAMRPLCARDPGPIAAALECTDAWFGMIVDGAHVDPAMLRLALRGSAHPMLVTDAMPPVGGSQQKFSLFERNIEARGEVCIGDDGTLAGTALGMASAVRNCVDLLGVPLTSALGYASLQPAAFLGIDDRFGRIAAGYRADMVAFEPNNIVVLGTFFAGIWEERAPGPE